MPLRGGGSSPGRGIQGVVRQQPALQSQAARGRREARALLPDGGGQPALRPGRGHVDARPAPACEE
eukprot:1398499-Lingulodinium_polyedra.AAC.1